MRHPNDVKIFEGNIPDHNDVSNNEGDSNDWKRTFEFIFSKSYNHYDDPQQNCYSTDPKFKVTKNDT